MPPAILQSIVTEEKGQAIWRGYRADHKEGRTKEAQEAWRILVTFGEKKENFELLRQREDEHGLQHAIHTLTRSKLRHDQRPLFELKDVLELAGFTSPSEAIRLLAREHRVNYHGHLCATLAMNETGEAADWDAEEMAFRVIERSAVTVVAFLNPTTRELPETTIRAEMEVSGGAERAVVPFKVAVDGYPLKFLDRSCYENLQVPSQGNSELMSFPIHPESLMSRHGRVPVWINCSQNNSLVQCVCVPLIISAKSPPKGTAEASS